MLSVRKKAIESENKRNEKYKEKFAHHFPAIYNSLIKERTSEKINWFEEFARVSMKEAKSFDYKGNLDNQAAYQDTSEKLFIFAREHKSGVPDFNMSMRSQFQLKDLNNNDLLTIAKNNRNQELLDYFCKQYLGLLTQEKTTYAHLAKQGYSLGHSIVDNDPGRNLRLAIYCRSITGVKECLNNLNGEAALKDMSYTSFFHDACREGNLEILKLITNFILLDYKNKNKNVTIKDLIHTSFPTEESSDKSSLYLAAENNHVEVMKYLLENGAYQANDEALKQSMHIACKKGHLEIVKLLIEQNKNLITEVDALEQSPLLIAARNNQTEVAKYLLTQLKDEKKFTLNHASKHDDLGNDRGNTALHWAVKNANKELVKALLAAKVSSITMNAKGQTPRDLAGDTSIRLSLVKSESQQTEKIVIEGGVAIIDNIPEFDISDEQRGKIIGVLEQYIQSRTKDDNHLNWSTSRFRDTDLTKEKLKHVKETLKLIRETKSYSVIDIAMTELTNFNDINEKSKGKKGKEKTEQKAKGLAKYLEYAKEFLEEARNKHEIQDDKNKKTFK